MWIFKQNLNKNNSYSLDIAFNNNIAFHNSCLYGHTELFNLFFNDKRVDISDLGNYAFKEAAISQNKYIIIKLINSLDLKYADWCDGLTNLFHKNNDLSTFIFNHPKFKIFKEKLKIKGNKSYKNLQKKLIVKNLETF